MLQKESVKSTLAAAAAVAEATNVASAAKASASVLAATNARLQGVVARASDAETVAEAWAEYAATTSLAENGGLNTKDTVFPEHYVCPRNPIPAHGKNPNGHPVQDKDENEVTKLVDAYDPEIVNIGPPCLIYGNEDAPCQHNGKAIGFEPFCSCDCSEVNFEGDLCQTESLCSVGANGQECKNGGKAASKGLFCGCDCDAVDYKGLNCEKPLPCTVGADGNVCQHGTAKGQAGSCFCDCTGFNFDGPNCERELPCVKGENNGVNLVCEDEYVVGGKGLTCGCERMY